jgi:hypothetical protein
MAWPRRRYAVHASVYGKVCLRHGRRLHRASARHRGHASYKLPIWPQSTPHWALGCVPPDLPGPRVPPAWYPAQPRLFVRPVGSTGLSPLCTLPSIRKLQLHHPNELYSPFSMVSLDSSLNNFTFGVEIETLLRPQKGQPLLRNSPNMTMKRLSP